MGDAVTASKTTIAPDEAGVEGNARLTAVNGVVLIVLLFVEGITILSVRGLITLHTFVGLMLVPPVLLKCVTTIYRFARYYAGRPAYVQRGPPAPVLRLLGPLVVITTLAVLGTGIGLLTVRPGQAGLWLPAHKASFVLWVILMTVHVLGHLRDAVTTSAREVRPVPGDGATRRRPARMLALAGALVLGVGLAAALTPSIHPWVGYSHFGDR